MCKILVKFLEILSAGYADFWVKLSKNLREVFRRYLNKKNFRIIKRNADKFLKDKLQKYFVKVFKTNIFGIFGKFRKFYKYLKKSE